MAPLPATVIFVKEKGTQDKPKRLCFSVYEYTIYMYSCQVFFLIFLSTSKLLMKCCLALENASCCHRVGGNYSCTPLDLSGSNPLFSRIVFISATPPGRSLNTTIIMAFSSRLTFARLACAFFTCSKAFSSCADFSLPCLSFFLSVCQSVLPLSLYVNTLYPIFPAKLGELSIS